MRTAVRATSARNARAYVDDACSYASNENAINWNAPLAYIAGALEAWYSPTGKPNPTGVKEGRNHAVPEGFGLLQNYPNPFSSRAALGNPSTHITCMLPSPGEVHLGIYALSGALIRTLAQGNLPSGQHTLSWNAETDAGTKVASGIYLARLRVRSGARAWSEARKIMLVQ